MVATKYGKYILRPVKKVDPKLVTPAVTPVIMGGARDWLGIQHRMKWVFVTKPTLIVKEPHSHDFDEFLGFYSSDPAHELDFGAEIELSLGLEDEKQFINSPTVVCLPKGLIHCPLNFKVVKKPVLFWRIYIAPEYVRKPVSK